MKSLFLLCLSVPYLIVQEPSTSNLRDNGVVQRGNQVMGFSHELSAHYFRLLKDGGEIIVTANNLNGKASIDQIRSHLAHISRMFADGNFNAAVLIHDTNPPGTATMTRLKSQIRYELSEIDQGAKIRIYSSPEATDAVHAFLLFQIVDHKTADVPTIGSQLRLKRAVLLYPLFRNSFVPALARA